MSVVGDINDLIKEVRGLAEKYHDRAVSEKLVELHGKFIDLQVENESLKKRINELEAVQDIKNDLEMDPKGWYVRISEREADKEIRYCAACFQNTGKLYPITQGSLHRDYFCTNCKMHYTG